MKQLTCEMCGGTDLIKDGGVFVCQTCGCKYSVEEAKKMMIEGTVEVQGTVQVDNSALVEKYLQNARRAKAKEDWEETEKYYNLVEQNEPDNIEAIFYSAYGKARLSLIDPDIYKREQIFNVLNNCVSIIDDRYNAEKSREMEGIITEISDDIVRLRASDYVFHQELVNGRILTDKYRTVKLFNRLHVNFIETLENITKIDKQVYLYDLIKKHCDLLVKYGELENDSILRRIRDEASSAGEKLAVQQRKERIEAYWAEHEEEKKTLENEKAQLESQLEEAEREKENVPGMEDIKALEERKKGLEDEVDRIAFFKIREKKAKEQEIEDVRTRIYEMKESIAPAVREAQDRVYAVRRKIADITRELTKDRRQE